MTQAQIRQIEKLTGQIEAVQAKIAAADRVVAEAVANAKKEMLRALRAAQQ